MRLSALYLNSMNNVKMKYEYLQNCSIYNKVEYNRKVGLLKQVLMIVKDRDDKLFTAVKQRAGNNILKVFILMKPTKRIAA